MKPFNNVLLAYNIFLALVPVFWTFIPFESLFVFWAETYAVLLIINAYIVIGYAYTRNHSEEATR